MASTLKIVNPLLYPEWDKLLLSSPESSFFHSSLWARVLYDSYRYAPHYLVRIQDNKIVSLFPFVEVNSLLTGKRGVSLPFTDYCEPITSGSNDFNELLDYMKNYGESRKWKYIEFRGGDDIIGVETSSTFYYRHVLKLSKDIDSVFENIKKGTKGAIKKAMRDGVTVSRSDRIDALKIFYQLHCMTRKKHGVPPQPFQFFQTILDNVISLGKGHIVLAEHQGKAIAGAVYLHFGDEAVYKFAASDIKYLHLRPNDFLMWDTIQWYCLNGFKRFSFGRTDAHNNGLCRYKKGWGAEEDTIHYYQYDIGKKEFIKKPTTDSGIATAFFRMTPLFLSRWLGRALYRHVG